MESFENHPWCPYSSQSGGEEEEEEEEEHRHDPHLAMARAKSPHHHHSSFLVDELDMLMEKAATTIQATWRGYLVRKRLHSEHEAASVIQAAWRGFITREYLAMQQEQVPSWNVRGSSRRRTPSPASSEDGRRSWEQPSMDKEKAAEVIQAHYRGYATRRAIAQCHQAATTIQAHWRGYQSRQQLSQGPTYYRPPIHIAGGPSGGPPYPRPHWQKVLVGEPDEWKAKRPAQPDRRRREHTEASQQKICPQCGRYTTVRVLIGVGKGPPSKSDMDESEYEEKAHSPAHRRARPKRRQASRSKERQNSTRNCPSGPRVSYPMCSPGSPGNCQMAGGCSPHRHSHCPGPLYPRYAMRPSRDCMAARSHSSTSVRYHRVRTDGTADSLFENYCTRPVGEGQKRVFKTRKHMWEVVRAATRIQSFWRGWQARRALRLQQEAATKIQSAYRGYKTRAYLTEAGVLSEGDTD